jgi:predicted nucleic acid-binding protein
MLVDASLWVEHFRHGNARLAELLESDRISTHPFVIGELLCENLSRRREVFGLLEALRTTPVADHQEVMRFLEIHRL